MPVRLQSRDWEIARHIYEARILPEGHIAKLCFEGRSHMARRRLYQLRGHMVRSAGSVKRFDPLTKEEGTQRLWELERWVHTALANERWQERKYPEPLAEPQLHHLLDTNDVYAAITLRFREQEVPGMYESDWYWLREPYCHRRFEGRAKRHTLAPDAEVRVFDEIFFLERQTSRAKEKDEKLHDRTFLYHSYENSLERRQDEPRARGDVPVPLVLLWACDTERDRRFAAEAKREHPTKTLRQLDMHDHDSRRVEVITEDFWGAVEMLHRSALNQAYELQRV